MTTDSLDALLHKFPAETRADSVDAALRSLKTGVATAQLVIAELLWELHAEHLYRFLRDVEGRPYASSFAYYVAVFGPAKPGKFYQRLRVGRAIRSVPLEARNGVRDQLGAMSIARAVAIAPALLEADSLEAFQAWLDRGRTLGTPKLLELLRRTQKPNGRRAVPCPTCGRPMRRASAVGAARA